MSRIKGTVYGIGINDSPVPVGKDGIVNGKRKLVWVCPFYKSWTNMLARCYSNSFHRHHPAYADCSVVKEWLVFSQYKEWMSSKDWENMHLDKDILLPGNKIYGPDFCAFITIQLNTFITDCALSRGKWPIGVSYKKQAKRFEGKCRNPFTGKQETLGNFDTPQEAHEAWRKRKHQLACQYADLQSDPRVANALRTRYAAS